MVSGHAQLFLQLQAVYLDHHTINFVRQAVSFFFETFTILHHIGDALEYFLFLFRTAKPEIPKQFQAAGMRSEFFWFRFSRLERKIADMVEKSFQVSSAHLGCILNSK